MRARLLSVRVGGRDMRLRLLAVRAGGEDVSWVRSLAVSPGREMTSGARIYTRVDSQMASREPALMAALSAP